MHPIKRWREDAGAPVDTRHVDVLDGVRALCIFIVAWYHIWQQSWLWPVLSVGGATLNLDPLVRSGYIWVDAMLLISGFLLYLPYAREMDSPLPSLPETKGFFVRRALRILPSYWPVSYTHLDVYKRQVAGILSLRAAISHRALMSSAPKK